MFNQIGNLEDVLDGLKRMDSLLSSICETYFNKHKPDANELVKNYRDYSNIIYVIQELERVQTTSLRSSIEACYETQMKVRKEMLEAIEILTQNEVKQRLKEIMVLLNIADLDKMGFYTESMR